MLSAALALAAAAASPPAAVTARIAHELSDETGRPGTLADGMVTRVDVNGDGVPDWHADFERAGPVAWCGTGGCRHQLYVSHAGGHVLAFDENARALSVRGGRVRVDVYGSYCGTAGVVECRRSFAWHGRERRLVAVKDHGQGSRLFGPLFQPVPVARADWPAAVAEAVAERAAACADAGATLDEGQSAVVRSPDLDGDDVEDWIVGSPWSLCRPPDTMPEAQAAAIARPILVAVSGGGAPAVIFQSATSDYVVDVSTVPARLILMPDADARARQCPDRPTRCAGTEVNYDPEKRWLEPFARPRATRRSRR